MTKFIAVVATDRINGIGLNNQIPWYVPEDLKFFKELTQGGVVIMGGNTARSLGKPLPDRQNWVISKQLADDKDSFGPDWVSISVTAFASVVDLLRYVAKNPALDDLFVIGGASIYEQLLPYCTEVYQTVLETAFKCDAHFPPFTGWNAWTWERIHHFERSALRPFEVNVLKHIRNLEEETAMLNKQYTTS